MDDEKFKNLEADWQQLEGELQKFQLNHKEYVKKLEEVESMKMTYLQQFEKYKKKLHQLKIIAEECDSAMTAEATKTQPVPVKPSRSFDSEVAVAETIISKVQENLNYMHHISDTFPRKNGFYLRIILGGVCVSILNKEEKWKYKEEYEKFKFVVTMISMVLSFLLLFIHSSRTFDAIYNFLMVWYYCTLTIRESILLVNGSNIKGWWHMHHFITTVCTAILLIWPDSESYRSFRMQFIWFSFYINFVQLMQYYYQRGSLYRLRALGEKQDMDVSAEGFQSWMTRGLSFLLPFLIIGYIWQFYNAYTLYLLSQSKMCNEWQAGVSSIIFFVLASGNSLTTYMVIRQKFRKGVINQIKAIKYKYFDWKNLTTPSEKAAKPKFT